MDTSSVFDFRAPSRTVDVWGDLEGDQVQEALASFRKIATNFRVEPSANGRGVDVWCDAYANLGALETRRPDVIERDNLILELREKAFRSCVVNAMWEPRRSGRSLRHALDVSCVIENSDYDLHITFQCGAVKFGFWPKRWNEPLSSNWQPIEVARHFRSKWSWSDDHAFALIRAIGDMAYEDRPIQSLLARAQAIDIPERPSDLVGWLGAEDPPSRNPDLTRRWVAPPPPVNKRGIVEEKPASLVLRQDLSVEEAEEFVRTLGDALTNFTVSGDDWYSMSIQGDVISDVSALDCRTDVQKLRDITIINLQRRGLLAEFSECDFYPPDRRVSVELFDYVSRTPLFQVSDQSVSFVGRRPGSNEEVWFDFSIEKFPGGAAAAYGLLSLVADTRARGESIEELLLSYGPTFSSLHGYDDDPSASAGLDSVIFEGGYVGDGLWISGSGIEDLGR